MGKKKITITPNYLNVPIPWEQKSWGKKAPRGGSDAQVIEGGSANLNWRRAQPLWGPHVACTIARLYICANEPHHPLPLP